MVSQFYRGSIIHQSIFPAVRFFTLDPGRGDVLRRRNLFGLRDLLWLRNSWFLRKVRCLRNYRYRRNALLGLRGCAVASSLIAEFGMAGPAEFACDLILLVAGRASSFSGPRAAEGPAWAADGSSGRSLKSDSVAGISSEVEISSGTGISSVVGISSGAGTPSIVGIYSGGSSTPVSTTEASSSERNLNSVSLMLDPPSPLQKGARILRLSPTFKAHCMPTPVWTLPNTGNST